MDFIPDYKFKNIDYNVYFQNYEENNTLKIKIENLEKENCKIKNENNELKNKNNELKNKNNELKNENNELKSKNKELKNELDIKKQNLNKCVSEINNLKSSLINETKERNNLIKEMENLRINVNLNNEEIRRDDIITIQFKSIDLNVDIAFSCKDTDIFVRIEEKLYNQYPEYKEYNTYFTVNGCILKRFKSIKENGIKNFDKILLNKYE